MSAPISRNRRKGQVLIMTTLVIVPMVGLLGLVTDLGYMHFLKMSAQTAAEAAAKAAVIDVHASYGAAAYTCGGGVVCASTPTACPAASGTAVQDGCQYARQNGFNPTGSQNVTYEAGVSSTPPTAPGMGPASYWVTFRVTQSVPQLFSRVLGNSTGFVAARSTAALVGATDCIYALDPSMQGSISVGGTANLTSNCGLYVNSDNACALSSNGGGTVSATEYDVVGNVCTHAPLSPSPNTGVYPASDPLAGWAAPASAPYTCNQTYPNGSGNGSTITVYPGVYCGGIQVKNNTVNFAPGVYILVGGGLTTQDSNSHINGDGVMFYNTFGSTIGSGNKTYAYSPINIAANSTVSLTAPTTGAYTGMLFFDDRSAPSGYPDSYGGGSTAVYQGIIYARNNGIYMYGNSSVNTQYTIVVADWINLVGTTSFNNNYSSLPNGASPLQQVVVVE